MKPLWKETRTWIASRNSFCGPSRSATCASCACGSPMWSGSLKSVALAPAEVEGAFEEGLGFDGSSIEGLSRIYESDMLAAAGSVHLPDPAVARGEAEPTSRMFCDILTPDGLPSAADPRNVLKRQLAVPRTWASPATPTRRSSSTCSSLDELGRRRLPGAGGPRRLLRPRPRRRRRRTSGARAVTHARGRGHLRGVQPPRGRAGAERDRPALRGCAADRRQHHDLPHRHQGGRAPAGDLRDLHAQAVLRPARLRHAHPLLPLRGRHQRVLRGRAANSSSPPRPASSSPGSCATRPSSRR